jgi:tRNA (adenine57-N1/adenine58-N1)-methyltransferase
VVTESPVLHDQDRSGGGGGNENSECLQDHDELVFGSGGFAIGQAAADAIFLDLPEPWLAIPHAAHAIKPNGSICSYSPCVEQTQRTVQALRDYGFHSLKTIEVRLREHYVDDVELDTVPTTKLPRDLNINSNATSNNIPGGHPAAQVQETDPDSGRSSPNLTTAAESSDENECESKRISKEDEAKGALHDSATMSSNSHSGTTKKRKMLCARPFSTMRGHTAFLTFATAGNKCFPDPNQT